MDSTSGYLISYPYSQTITSINSEALRQPLCFFQELHFVKSCFDRDQYTGLAFTAVTVDIPLEMVPNLIISILLDFFSLTITGCDFQGWSPPSGLVMFDPGPGEAGQTFSPDSGALPSVYHAL